MKFPISPSDWRATRVLLLILILLPLLGGCDTLQFYRQAAWGQWQLLHARKPLDNFTDQHENPNAVGERLLLAQRLLTFGDDVLLLPRDGRYTSYVHLDRKFVVWNVFASDPFDLEGRQWCYPLVGCAPYRGFFRHADAIKAAQKYDGKGLETYVGGVPAYSTLGWFEDPLLSTFIMWPEPELANLLLHEMAHTKVWVNGDVAFNESFAEFVGQRGARAWLASEAKSESWLAWMQRRAAWRNFRAFTVIAKSHLQEVYVRPVTTAERSHRKSKAMAGIQACYQAQRSKLGAGRYDKLMAERFNNAFLVSVGTYTDWLPAFVVLFAQAEGQWAQFYRAVENLADLDADERSMVLTNLAEEKIAQDTDHNHADEINCDAFLSHRAHGKTTG